MESSPAGIIRVAPPLVVSEDQINESLSIIKESIKDLLDPPAL